ncbi:hypothetical protein AB6805_30445 [Chitinophaga sp. RCC_12]|uniref:DUF7768 domain-containing protein n=1 Tax=Chitinophaga sp. RCC_12 TaxID=3239226 RepID=UPI003523B9ED
MKIVYIAHPIGGDVENNLADLRRIIRKINLEMLDILPFCPYYADVVSMDDNVRKERERCLSNDVKVIKSGMVDEMWLTGRWVSAGMDMEKDLAIYLGIPVVDLTNRI